MGWRCQVVRPRKRLPFRILVEVTAGCFYATIEEQVQMDVRNCMRDKTSQDNVTSAREAPRTSCDRSLYVRHVTKSENNLKMSLENIQDKVWYWRAMVWSELKEHQIN